MPLNTREGQEQGSFLSSAVQYSSETEDDAAWWAKYLNPQNYPVEHSQTQPDCIWKPYLEVLEQPRELMSFRTDNPSFVYGRLREGVFPSVRIVDYTGFCLLVVSLVTNEEPRRPHPHELWMPKTEDYDQQKGIYLIQNTPRDSEDGNQVFNIDKLRLFAIKRLDELKYVKESLQKREKLGVDPFRTNDFTWNGDVKDQLDRARICYEAYIVANEKLFRLPPVLTDLIRNMRARKVQEEIGDGDVKLVTIIPEVVTIPTFGISLFVEAKRLNDRYRICFKVEGETYPQYVEKDDIRGNTCIGVKDCYVNIPIAKRTSGVVYLSRVLKDNSEERCSNELPIEFDPSKDKSNLDMSMEVISGKRKRRSSEGYSIDDYPEFLLPEGSHSFKRMALGDSEPYDLEGSNDEGLSYLGTMKDTTKDDGEVLGS